MNLEVLKNQARDRLVDGLITGGNVVRRLGDFALWYVRDLETPPQAAHIEYYECEERRHD